MVTVGMRPIHPGEILLEDYLKPLGMSVNALSKELYVPAQRLNEIVRERSCVTADTAMRLARYFGTTEQFWLNLQTDYDLRRARAEKSDQINKLITPRKPDHEAA